jgi:hypothetical protein
MYVRIVVVVVVVVVVGASVTLRDLSFPHVIGFLVGCYAISRGFSKDLEGQTVQKEYCGCLFVCLFVVVFSVLTVDTTASRQFCILKCQVT